MGWLIGIGISIIVVYLMIGVIAAGFVKFQTDDKFDLSLVFTWLWKIFH